MNDKITVIDELVTIVANLKKIGKTIVHCHGVFDLLHPGHIRHLEAAKQMGDVLIITLTQDKYVNKGPGRPVFNQRLRAESLAALNVVDYVAINHWESAVETIYKLQPNIYVKGSDYLSRDLDLTGNIKAEEEAIIKIGGGIHFTDEIAFSSSHLLNSYFNILPDTTIAYLRDFRQQYTTDNIFEKIRALESMKVLVIGDTIVDEYCFCGSLGSATNSPTLAVNFIHEENYVGGVLAVANHLASYLNQVDLITCIGADETRQDFIVNSLKPNIFPEFITRHEASTTLKRRYLNRLNHQQLFEVNFGTDRPIQPELEIEIIANLSKIIHNYDLVMVADFGYGLLESKIINFLCENIGRSSGKTWLAVNTHTNNANSGFNLITKYPRADYACINQMELRVASHDRHTSLDRLIQPIAEQLKTAALTITTGEQGSISYHRDRNMINTPAFTNQVLDNTDASDIFFSWTAPSIAAGYQPELVDFIGNCVMALSVKNSENKESIPLNSLFKFITTLLK